MEPEMGASAKAVTDSLAPAGSDRARREPGLSFTLAARGGCHQMANRLEGRFHRGPH